MSVFDINPPRLTLVLVITNSSKVPWRGILHEPDMIIPRNRVAYQHQQLCFACMIAMADIIGTEHTFWFHSWQHSPYYLLACAIQHSEPDAQ